ncbi:iron-sulfur cluster assembly protein [Taklimakanibacter deserti]|uniref:iron-sulfur cluster assembly protein n=1 Tax=Taklimakanibacter deserti TaxID=2267839 RepID=UPI000E64CF20
MGARRHATGPIAEVWSRLDAVTDPELDEAVTDLDFIESVEVSDTGEVDIAFRLPTYWCSANFAFLMADDIRRQVSALPWVTRVRPRLEDHMCADDINHGVQNDMPFDKALAGFGTAGSLDEVRDKFRRKAFERRQEAVLRALLAQGLADAHISAMTSGLLAELLIEDASAARQRRRYLDLLAALGHVGGPISRAFVTYDGSPIAADELAGHLQRLKAVRINMEFGGALCRGLLAARYREFDPEKDEPTLVDFMLDRVPPRKQADNGREGVPDHP